MAERRKEQAMIRYKWFDDVSSDSKNSKANFTSNKMQAWDVVNRTINVE